MTADSPPDAPPPKSDANALRPGDKIGAYTFIRELGSGGMARVLLARDELGQLVALKVLRRSRFRTGIKRFKREFKALARIRHPNVIRVDAYGELNGHPYIAMEYVDGPDLHALIRGLRSWRFEARWERAEQILVDLCRALAEVHRRGLVHRDLKPSNVLIAKDGPCKLTDFGIVKDLDPSQDPFLSTTLVGTWAYASPEQIGGQPVDHRSDLYSLGVILFATLTGKRPFVANDMAGYLSLHRERTAPAPSQINPQVPAHLDEICLRLLQKSPSERYQSALEVLYRLESEERIVASGPRTPWSPRLVGRGLETSVIRTALGALSAGRGDVIALEGESGAGKSRFIELIRSESDVHGHRVFVSEVTDSEGAFGSTLRIAHLVAEGQSDVPFDLSAPPASESVSPAHPFFTRILSLLATAAQHTPNVFVLDDFHNASVPEIQLWAYIARSLIVDGELPLVIVVSLRPRANPAADAFAVGQMLGIEPRHMLLDTLQPTDVETLLFELLGDSLPVRLLAKRLYDETGGNAGFLIEYIDALMGSGIIVRGEAASHTLRLSSQEVLTHHLDLPVNIRRAMKRCLATLTDAQREIAEHLAVLDRPSSKQMLFDYVDTDDAVVEHHLKALMALGVVKTHTLGDGERVVIALVPMRDLVYRELTPERRANLHTKAAALYEHLLTGTPEAYEIVASHHLRAGSHGFAYQAYSRAAASFAARDQAADATRAVETSTTIERTAYDELPNAAFRSSRERLLEARARIASIRGDGSDALEHWRSLLASRQESGDALGTCEAMLHMAQAHAEDSHFEQAMTLATQALEASRRLSFDDGARGALRCMAQISRASGRLAECQRLIADALKLTPADENPTHHAELLILNGLAVAETGHLQAARRFLLNAESVCRAHRLRRARCDSLLALGNIALWLGQPLEARQRTRAAAKLARRMDHLVAEATANAVHAEAGFELGDYVDSEALLDVSMRFAQTHRSPELFFRCVVVATQLALEASGVSAAKRVLSKMHGWPGPSTQQHHWRPLLDALRVGLEDQQGVTARVQALLTEQGRLPIPTRVRQQLILVQALSSAAANDSVAHALSIRLARAALRVADNHGLRLASLRARANLATLTEAEERTTHKRAGQAVAKAFAESISPQMATAFMRRPWLRDLEI